MWFKLTDAIHTAWCCVTMALLCAKKENSFFSWDTQIFGTEIRDGKSSVSKSFWSDSILLYRACSSAKISQSPFPLSNPIIYPKKILFSFQSCYTFPYGVGWVPESTITVIITQSPSPFQKYRRIQITSHLRADLYQFLGTETSTVSWSFLLSNLPNSRSSLSCSLGWQEE